MPPSLGAPSSLPACHPSSGLAGITASPKSLRGGEGDTATPPSPVPFRSLGLAVTHRGQAVGSLQEAPVLSCPVLSSPVLSSPLLSSPLLSFLLLSSPISMGAVSWETAGKRGQGARGVKGGEEMPAPSTWGGDGMAQTATSAGGFHRAVAIPPVLGAGDRRGPGDHTLSSRSPSSLLDPGGGLGWQGMCYQAGPCQRGRGSSREDPSTSCLALSAGSSFVFFSLALSPSCPARGEEELAHDGTSSAPRLRRWYQS